MNLPRFSVRNPVTINLVMIAVLVGGVVAVTRLVREFFPAMEAEQAVITVLWPGATPEEIERGVTRRIEREIEDVEDVDEVRARVFEGVTLIQVEMEEGADRDRVLEALRAELDKVKPDLPDGAEEPELAEARPFIPAIAVVVHGTTDERRLREVVDDIRDDLLDLPDVTELLVTGIRDREHHVEVRPDDLERYGLTIADVAAAIGATNRDVPGGLLEGSNSTVRVRTLGESQRAEALESIVVRPARDGAVVRVADVADVRESFEDRIEKGRFEGHRAAAIYVFKTPEQDAIAIAEQVRAYVAKDPERLGGAVQLAVTTDLSRIIEDRIDLMQRNALAGLTLVLLTLALFLELRVALWVAVGLGVAFVGTFLLMALFGQTINLMSLFGLIIVLGLLVDDAIVVGENVFTRQREGVEPHRAAIEGANEVAMPVVAAVTTTVVAFLPLAFIPGRIGTFLGVLPIVVIFALTMSLFESLVILPSHLAHVRPPATSGPRAVIARWLAPLARLGAMRHRLFEGALPRLHGKLVSFLVRWRYVTIAAALVLLMVAGGVVAGGLVPFTLLGNNDAETVTVKLEMAAGTPEERTWDVLGHLEDVFRNEPEVKSVLAVQGASFSDRGRETPSDAAVVGQLTIELLTGEERDRKGLRSSTKLVSDLRRRTQDLPGVRLLEYLAQSGGPRGADIEIRLRGRDLDLLEKATQYVREALDTFQGIEEANDDRERGKVEARVRLREDARLLGFTTTSVAQELRQALFGFEVQDLQVDDEEITVRVLLPEARRRAVADLALLRVTAPDGSRVPLSEVIDVNTERGFASIQRVDGQRTLTIVAQVDTTSGANTSDITRELESSFLAELDQRFPGVTYSFEGQRRETVESVGSLAYLFPIALLLIFFVIATLFRSYLQPIVVMSVIPFAVVGAIAGHGILGYDVTILSMIGIVALAGIVVNDGLILVDLANRLRRQGMDATQAVVAASQGRLRAILLTSITTCVGLAPLMLETSFQAKFLIPMAISIVFGLGFGTALVLALMPCVYMAFEDARAGLRWLVSGRWHRELPHDPAAFVE
ncbi:MAG: efflux RND transporter permease subunit [Planctomycetes bacterium]|nr:efflux RND transporter permease subunit [Planctomycetota bacterium]